MQDPETVSTEESSATEQPKRSLNIGRFLSELAAAVTKGDVSNQQARDLRRQLGISQSFFTKKKRDPAKEKARKKIAKASRRRNRGLGKGQKRTGGNGVYSVT